ncbi:MAG: site-specific integrase [Treponema sp.]|jgi:integrase|nr:site-specific integrase [Treponema sp.]
MGVKIRINRGKLFLDIIHKGNRHWESLGLSVTADRAQMREIMRLAEIARSKRETQLFSGEWDLLDPVSGKKSLYAYLEELGKDRDKRKDRVNKVLPYLKKYPGGESVQIGQIAAKWVADFQRWLLKDTGLSESSAASYAAGIRIALKKAARERIIPYDPAESVKAIGIPETDGVVLNAGEIQRLAKTPLGGGLGADVKRAFLFACYTALRISDLKTITWGDVQRTPALQIIKRQKKTSRKVYIPIHETAWRIIDDGKIHLHTEPVFPRLAAIASPVNDYLKTWGDRAGIERRFGWHAARRSCATLLLESGADLATVKKICGHRDIKVTQLYAKATDAMTRRAVNALPNIEIE